MEEIIRADLGNWQHGQALVWLLNEYAKDEMGGGCALSAEVRAGLAQALAARDNAHVLLAWVDGQPAGVATCFEGFSTFACRCSICTIWRCTRTIVGAASASDCWPRWSGSPASSAAAS